MINNIYLHFERFIEKKFLILPTLSILYWASFNLSPSNQQIKEINGLIFGSLIALISFVGSYFTYLRAKEWQLFKSFIGKSLFFISLALMFWGVGQTVYIFTPNDGVNYYDLFFGLIDPFYLLGVFFIAKSINTLKNIENDLKLFLLPIIVLIVNFFAINSFRYEEILDSINNFDINLIYILGSVLLSTFVITILIISGKKLGGKFRSALNFILIGIIFQYIADNLFAFNELFQENGSLADLVFFISISFVIFGVTKLNPRNLKK